MNTVLIIPTGVGAEIGGHAGDGNPVAKLLASVSDILITHPNVVNASDINEMTENTWYVEGSMLDRFLSGEVNLKQPTYNKILVAVNAPVEVRTINAVSAARATIGIDASIVELETPLVMEAAMVNGMATGEISGVDELIEQVEDMDFDALAIITRVSVSKETAYKYLTEGGVNPWGGVEAILSKRVSKALLSPVAHAPFGDTLTNFDQVVDPRMAAELVSICYMHCVLKGLHRAPQYSFRDWIGLTHKHVDCIVMPAGVHGRPHSYAMGSDIPMIIVKGNKTVCREPFFYKKAIEVENYLEAAGVIACMKAGIYWESVIRPLEPTEIIK